MNQQNLTQFLAAARQYFFGQTTIETSISSCQAH